MTYTTLKEILIDTLRTVPEYKHYFYGMFIQSPSRVVVKMNPAVNPYVKEFYKNEPEYFKVLDEFINTRLAKYYNKKVIAPKDFNKIINLSILMPDIVDFLFKNAADILVFSTSHAYLRYAAESKVPLDYFAHLALVLITDEMSYNLKKIKNIDKRNQAEIRLDAMKVVTINSMMILSNYSRILEERVKIGVKGKPTDIFAYKNKAYSLKLFDGMNARVIILLADRGCGKTIGLFRCIYSVLNKGYTVIIFGEDRRKEFRFANFPMKKALNEYYYRNILNQNTRMEGMPITIYCDNPELPIEKNITDFGGSKNDWENLSGVVLFESKKVTEKEWMDSYTKDKKGEIKRQTFKIYRKAELARIMESFLKWRAQSRAKKIVMCLNEAQNFIGSQVDKSTWGIFWEAEKLFTDIRGLGVPVIMNTQYLSKLKKSGRQNDVLFISHITDATERKLIADIYNKPNLKYKLSVSQIKQRHEFFKIEYGKEFKVKFLLPPYMPENKLDLKNIFKN